MEESEGGHEVLLLETCVQGVYLGQSLRLSSQVGMGQILSRAEVLLSEFRLGPRVSWWSSSGPL